jgi:transposase
MRDAVVAVGGQLIDHPGRIGPVTAPGLDETLFACLARFRTQCWSTQIVDVRRGQLLDVVASRDAAEPCRWLATRVEVWRVGIYWAKLALSAACRTVLDAMPPDARRVAESFHLVRLANQVLDECRRRAQNETLGRRGRKDDPRWRARRQLTMARERLTDDQHGKVLDLLRADDPPTPSRITT